MQIQLASHSNKSTNDQDRVSLQLRVASRVSRPPDLPGVLTDCALGKRTATSDHAVMR